LEHRATVLWQRTSQDYTYNTYNRDHSWRFHAVSVPASAAPEYRGNPECVNPEEAFVASLSSCHMLTFLAIAAKKKLSLDSYSDEAVGYLEKGVSGKMMITRVVLHPRITWSPSVVVSREVLDEMHHGAHAECFIANSVSTEISVEPFL
jgi:organic hydroperoxide reductase OsmC/OhrA